MSLNVAVGGDSHATVVTVAGRLGLEEVAEVRLRLLKCLAEQPDAVLVDLSELVVRRPLALSVFAAVLRQAGQWPGIPFVLCAPSPEVRSMLGTAAYRRIPLFATVAMGREFAADHRETLPVLRDVFLPLPGAARQARNLVTESCVRWDVPDLVAPASLIASELVSNVVDHANTMATVLLSLRPRYLTIAVRDGSPEEPTARTNPDSNRAHGRGLLIVEATAHTWGWLPCDSGKVVWASLAR